VKTIALLFFFLAEFSGLSFAQDSADDVVTLEEAIVYGHLGGGRVSLMRKAGKTATETSIEQRFRP